jgi:hypothetical protein
MALTVEDVIDRCYRRYLSPAFDQPISSTLNADITAGATSLTLTAFSSIEYSDAIQRGGVIEIGQELIRVTEVTDQPLAPAATTTLSVVRGVMGTDADAHTAGDEVIVAPVFPRHDVALAVYDEIEALYPDLWAVKQEVWEQPPYDLPDDFADLMEVIVDDGRTRWPVHEAYVHQDSFGDTILNLNGNTGYTVSLTYAASFPRPTSNNNTLTALNLQDRWADIIAMGATIQYLTGQNTSDLSADYLTEIAEIGVTEQVDPKSIESNLRRARALKLNEERRRLRASTRTWTQRRSVLGI